MQEKSSEDDDDLDEDTVVDDRRVVVVGVCAMAKKSNSRPMQEILERLVLFKDIRTFVFEESVILHVNIVAFTGAVKMHLITLHKSLEKNES